MATNAYKMMTISKGDQSFTLRIDEDEYEKILQDPALVASYWQLLSKSDTTNTASQDDKSSEIADDDITEIPVSPKQFQEKPDIRKRDKGDYYHWKYSSAHLLIQLRKEMNDDFKNPEFLKRNLWKQVAKQMNIKGYNVNEDDCDRKWRNMVTIYQRIKEYSGDQSDIPTRWRFYSQIDNIIGKGSNTSRKRLKKPLVRGLQSLTSRTITKRSDVFSKANHIEETGESLNHPSLVTDPDTLNNTVSNRIVAGSSCICEAPRECNYLQNCDASSLDPPHWFKEYEKKIEEKWDRWEKVTHEKIEAIKDLTTIIKDLVESRNNI